MSIKLYVHWNQGEEIRATTDHIKIENHVGKWYVVDESYHNGEKVFELEHETYGDEAAHLIVNKNGKVILDDVWNSFSDLELL